MWCHLAESVQILTKSQLYKTFQDHRLLNSCILFWGLPYIISILYPLLTGSYTTICSNKERLFVQVDSPCQDTFTPIKIDSYRHRHKCFAFQEFYTPFVLEIDTSGMGLGTVFLQEHDNIHMQAYLLCKQNSTSS